MRTKLPMNTVIIGGGISGLALAYSLQKRYGKQLHVTLLEQSSRSGGWIHSVEHEGFLFEQGPRSCRSHGAGRATLELIEALGLQSKTISASQEAKKRYLYINGQLQVLPGNIWQFFRSPLMQGFCGTLFNEWKTPALHEDDESIRDFFTRRFSPDVAERFIDPLVSGIYGGDIDRLSMAACFPEIWRSEQQHGSLLRAAFKALFAKKKASDVSPFVASMQAQPIFTFTEGMETLVKGLSESLGDILQLNCSVKTLSLKTHEILIETDDGKRLSADRVFLALPAHAAAKIIAPSQATIASRMEESVATSMAVVNMGWRKEVLPQEGFGYLIPSKEREDILGMVWDSSAFPQQNKHPQETRMTVMLGGARHPEMVHLSDDELVALAFNALKRHLGIDVPADVVLVSRAKQAIPQYQVGHLSRLNQIEKALADWSKGRVSLVGSSWHGVSVNDCISEANKMSWHDDITSDII